MEENETYSFVPALVGATTSLCTWLKIDTTFFGQITPDFYFGIKAIFSLLMAVLGGVLAEVARQEVKKMYNKKN